jgi:hypothetical protein
VINLPDAFRDHKVQNPLQSRVARSRQRRQDERRNATFNGGTVMGCAITDHQYVATRHP